MPLNYSLEPTRASRSARDEFASLLRLARAAQADRYEPPGD